MFWQLVLKTSASFLRFKSLKKNKNLKQNLKIKKIKLQKMVFVKKIFKNYIKFAFFIKNMPIFQHF